MGRDKETYPHLSGKDARKRIEADREAEREKRKAMRAKLERLKSRQRVPVLNGLRTIEEQRVAAIIDRDKKARSADAPQVPTPEAEQHGEYIEQFVMHAETQTMAQAKRNKGISSFVRMHYNGQLTNEQFVASQQIQNIIQRLVRGVALRGASLEARVDNARSSTDSLIEALELVRDEIAYSRWRGMLRTGRRMIIAMMHAESSLSRIARRNRMSWIKARVVLVDALDLFIEVREKVRKDVDEHDIEVAQARATGLTNVNEKRK